MSEKYSNLHESSQGRQYKQKFNGFYLGIVIQNNDPEKRGRIKVFVPHVSPTVYENWDQSNDDKSFKFIGDNINSDLTPIIDKLKDILPWSEYAAPVAGESASGRYNAYLKLGTISDSNKLQTCIPDTSTQTSTPYKLNTDNIGEKPARIYETKDLKVNDAFNDSKTNNTKYVNKYSYNYTPNSYSNCAKGEFSIPNVGAHVWQFYIDGDPMFPVFFAVSFGQEDWKSIFDSNLDYPESYENKSVKDESHYNHNTETYRNKWVFNQKGGTLEIVNTDNRELLKLTHYSGAFKEFNNFTTIEFAPNNDQKLVLKDQFLTVKGNRNDFTQGDYDLITQGDMLVKTGNFNYTYFQKWKDIVQNIAEAKQLFEIKRTSYTDSGNLYIKRNSVLQTKNPPGFTGHAACPVCSHPNRESYWYNFYRFDSYTKVNQGSYLSIFDGINDSSIFSNVKYTGGVPSILKPVDNSPGNLLGGGSCPCCGGSGYSPSSENGTFVIEDKDTKVIQQLRDNIKQLATIERELGLGGSQIINITKHKIETIGLLMNDFPSIRIDEIGKIGRSDVQIMPGGVITNQKPSSLIEYVHVDDLPGGSYNLNVCNRYNVQVGAGGISFKSYGPVDIGGTIVNLVGEQVNVSSEHEINICSKRVNIVAEILSLRQKNYNQIIVDSNLGVSQNLIVGGGCHIEGELTLQHVTAPCEIQESEEVVLEGWIPPEEVARICDPEHGGHYICSGDPRGIRVFMNTHSHQFKNLPLTLVKSTEDVRKVGGNCNKAFKAPAFPPQNEHKDPISIG